MKKILFLTMALLIMFGGNTNLHAAAAQPEGKRSADDQSDDIKRSKLDDNQEHFRAGVAAMTLDEKNRELLDAVNSKDLEKVQILLAEGADKDIRGAHRQTPLFIAVDKGFTEIVQHLIDAGASIDSVNVIGTTPLCVAVDKGFTKIVQILIAAGANKEIKDKYNKTALYKAVNKGFTEIAQSLIAAGASVDSANAIGVTPLYVAVDKGFTKIAQSLIAAGANKEIQDENKETVLYLAIKKGFTEIAKSLIAAGASVHVNQYKKTPLVEAVRNGQTEIVKSLLAAGAWTDYRCGENLLSIAVRERHTQIVTLLRGKKLFEAIERNDRGLFNGFITDVDLDFAYSNDLTLLALAEKLNRVEMVRLIKQKQLFDAIEKNDITVFNALIAAGVDIQSRDLRGLTLLHAAAQVGNAQATQELLYAGADIYAVDKFGNTPFGSAAYKMNTVLGNTNYVSVRGNYEKFEPLKGKKEKYPHVFPMDFLDQKVRTSAIEKEAEKYQSVMQILLDAELMQAASEHNQGMTRSLIAGREYLGNRRMQPTREAIQKALGKAESFGDQLVESKKIKIKNQEVIELLTGSLQKQ